MKFFSAETLFRNKHLIRAFVWCFMAFFLIGPLCGFRVYGTLTGVFIGMGAALIAAILAAPLIVLIAGYFGDAAGMIYSGSSRDWKIREQLEGDMNRAKHMKIKKDYEQARLLIDEILTKDPEYPEALFLKAQVLIEGFENRPEASECLKKIIGMPQADKTIKRWAYSLFKEISQ